MSRFQSTRPIRGATCAQSIVEFAQDISIHAPHTGRDTPWSTPWTGSPYFNPRAPYGARLALIWRPAHDQNFNPRAPYGARRGRTGEPIRGAFISIHAPHTGRDLGYGLQVRDGKLFQSTRPIRGATSVYEKGAQFKTISIHAPHTGRDPRRRRRWDRGSDFNPRAPYGARQHGFLAAQVFKPISIHAPHTGRDRRCDGDCFMVTIISIHAPHTGRDHRRQRQMCIRDRGATTVCNVSCFGRRDFNPRAPYGARLHFCTLCRFLVCISIHAPHTGRDLPRAK